MCCGRSASVLERGLIFNGLNKGVRDGVISGIGFIVAQMKGAKPIGPPLFNKVYIRGDFFDGEVADISATGVGLAAIAAVADFAVTEWSLSVHL